MREFDEEVEALPLWSTWEVWRFTRGGSYEARKLPLEKIVWNWAVFPRRSVFRQLRLHLSFCSPVYWCSDRFHFGSWEMDEFEGGYAVVGPFAGAKSTSCWRPIEVQLHSYLAYWGSRVKQHAKAGMMTGAGVCACAALIVLKFWSLPLDLIADLDLH